jgi:hypothetical protein
MMHWGLTAVISVASQLVETRLIERRRYPRVALTLPGRYMAHDRQEYPCRTINLSPGGIAILSMAKGFIGERVIAYFDYIGRIEGMIVRAFDSCFAVAMQLPAPKRERLTYTIAWLVSQRDSCIIGRWDGEVARSEAVLGSRLLIPIDVAHDNEMKPPAVPAVTE